MISFRIWRGHALRKTVGFLILALYLTWSASAATLTVNASGGAMYTKIQDAIYNASAGDTILVDSGPYYENVDVNKQLFLRGIDDGDRKPVVDSGGVGSAITLNAGNTTLEGFKTVNGSSPKAGIDVKSNYNIIRNNTVSNNSYGIYLSYSNNNTLIDNIVSNNSFGVYLSSSSNNMLNRNNVNSNIDGIIIVYSSNNSLNDNIVNTNQEDGIYLHTSDNNMLSSNTASNNKLGINVIYSNNCIFSRNNISNNNNGIDLVYSNNNTLMSSTISNNFGIWIEASSNNLVYDNYFNNNYNFALTNSGSVTWNIIQTLGTNIIGGPYLGGNVWANPDGTSFSQICADSDNDGICDLPYTLYGTNTDYLPLAYKSAIIPPLYPTIWDASAAPAVPYIWSSSNLEGFNYTETLTLLGNYAATRAIPRNGLVYTTGKVPVDFKVFEKEAVTVDGDQSYQVIGWPGDKWVAIKGISHKAAKLAYEMDKEDKKTLTPGETWALGSGYELIIDAIEARTTPRQVSFILKKDGAVIDEGIGQAPDGGTVPAKQKAVYYKTKTILGESDALLFTVYVDTIFSGAISDMVQFKYLWLIDESSAREIRAADRYGVFEVRTANSTEIMMDNEDNISLSRNSEATLMGNMKFVIEDNDTLRFYPRIVDELTPTPIPTPTPTPTPTPKPTPLLVSAVTPNSRNAQVGIPVTVFKTVINGGTATATGVSITQASNLPVTVSYQKWDGTAFTGSANTPVDMPAGSTANFVITIDATSTFNSSSMTFNVSGTNVAAAPVSAVNTLTMAASATPSADVIMMSTSLGVITGVNTATAFAVATANVGGASATGVSLILDIPDTITGLMYQLNETYPANGTIKGPATGLTIAVGAQPTFAVFLTPTQPIAYDPANDRITLQLVNGSGKVIGAQSVSISTT